MKTNTETEEPPQSAQRHDESTSVYIRGSALSSVHFVRGRSSVGDTLTTYTGPPKAFRTRESTNTRVTTEIEEPEPKNIIDLTDFVKGAPVKAEKSFASVFQNSFFATQNVDVNSTGNVNNVKETILFVVALVIVLGIGFGIGIPVGENLGNNIEVAGTNAPTGDPAFADESNCVIGFDEAFGSCQVGNRNTFMCVSEKQYMECDNANNPVLGPNGGIALSICPGTSLCICNQFVQLISNNLDPCNGSNANQCFNF